jgi:hypothetical protein
LLSMMPAAITTFAITQQLGVGAERTRRAIVATTVISAATIPLAAWHVTAWPAVIAGGGRRPSTPRRRSHPAWLPSW